VPDPLSKGGAVDAIPIAEERAGRLVPRERLDDLLRGPLGGRMLGHVAMHHTPAPVSEDHEDEEHAERHRRHDKKVQGDQILHVILAKGFPRGGWWLLALQYPRTFYTDLDNLICELR
jgi:hypothetical protein